MKTRSMIFLAILLFLLPNCGNNTAATNETQTANNTTADSKETPTEASVSGNSIVGEWEQQITCVDKNGNHKLEPEEKKASGTPLGFNWFRFNADGTCLREKDVEIKGTYEIQEKNGTKELVGDDLNYTIIELSGKELILGGEGVFMVYKRIK